MIRIHYRRNPTLDEQVDLTEKIFGRKAPWRTLRLPLMSSHAGISFADQQQVDFNVDEMILDFGVVGYTKQHERLVETKFWGNDEVHFVETWQVSYTWLQPTHVDGSKIE